MVHTRSLLLPHHQALIDDSAISDNVAAGRGYRSVTARAELERLGFGCSQCRVPALLIPVHDVHGDIATYQWRSDEPRVREGNTAQVRDAIRVQDGARCTAYCSRVSRQPVDSARHHRGCPEDRLRGHPMTVLHCSARSLELAGHQRPRWQDGTPGLRGDCAQRSGSLCSFRFRCRDESSGLNGIQPTDRTARIARGTSSHDPTAA